jgi:hypothetical protein
VIAAVIAAIVGGVILYVRRRRTGVEAPNDENAPPQ